MYRPNTPATPSHINQDPSVDGSQPGVGAGGLGRVVMQRRGPPRHGEVAAKNTKSPRVNALKTHAVPCITITRVATLVMQTQRG